MTNLQKAIAGKACRYLKRFAWYRGVNLTYMPKDWEIRKIGANQVIKGLITETAYWDER